MGSGTDPQLLRQLPGIEGRHIPRKDRIMTDQPINPVQASRDARHAYWAAHGLTMMIRASYSPRST
jgi:hypothetical protein